MRKFFIYLILAILFSSCTTMDEGFKKSFAKESDAYLCTEYDSDSLLASYFRDEIRSRNLDCSKYANMMPKKNQQRRGSDVDWRGVSDALQKQIDRNKSLDVPPSDTNTQVCTVQKVGPNQYVKNCRDRGW